jgi:hypothetical protein
LPCSCWTRLPSLRRYWPSTTTTSPDFRP